MGPIHEAMKTVGFLIQFWAQSQAQMVSSKQMKQPHVSSCSTMYDTIHNHLQAQSHKEKCAKVAAEAHLGSGVAILSYQPQDAVLAVATPLFILTSRKYKVGENFSHYHVGYIISNVQGFKDRVATLFKTIKKKNHCVHCGCSVVEENEGSKNSCITVI